MTAEGAPPERAAGIACGCQIANHHLRGFGKVRWEKDHVAVIEHHYGGTAAVNARAYADETRKLSEQLARAREEIKKLRGMREGLTRQLDAAILAKEEKDQGVLGEMARLKHKKTSLEDKHRALAQKYEALKAELEAASKGRVGATALGALPKGDHPLGASRVAARPGRTRRARSARARATTPQRTTTPRRSSRSVSARGAGRSPACPRRQIASRLAKRCKTQRLRSLVDADVTTPPRSACGCEAQLATRRAQGDLDDRTSIGDRHALSSVETAYFYRYRWLACLRN